MVDGLYICLYLWWIYVCMDINNRYVYFQKIVLLELKDADQVFMKM